MAKDKKGRKPMKSEEDARIKFTFRLPRYLEDAWRRRKLSQPFSISNQAYLNKLVEDDLIESGCITKEIVDAAKEAEENNE